MPRSRPLSSERIARCPAAGSLSEALNNAVAIVCLEFRLPGDRAPARGCNCAELRKWFDGEKASILSLVVGVRRKYRASAVLKSCHRLFDTPCAPCDRIAANLAREDWYRVVGIDRSGNLDAPTEWSRTPIETLKQAVRELVGLDWAKEVRGGEAIPDQQGCLENERRNGGTFGVGYSEEVAPANHVRVGVAKQKGKLRVVTMQSSRVKRVLTPVHDALYKSLATFGWLVKGELNKGHILPVVEDIKSGEVFVSGDYKSATDMLHSSAVLAVVEVLCEARHLTNYERNTLLQSFTDLKRVSRTGGKIPIKQGSMMGNLCSFPVLCLLNKACHDIARDSIEPRREGKRDRRVRINGDDIVTCGDDTFFARWKEVTSHYGFIVNEEKTGRSRRFLELNSRVYDTRRNRFVGKPVLSFLRRTDSTGDLLSEVVKGLATFSKRVFWYVLNVVMRREISLREISVSALPKWVWQGLLKKPWFRSALLRGPAPTKITGEDRCYPTTVGPLPHPSIIAWIDATEERIRERFVQRWRGLKVLPREEKIDRQSVKSHLSAQGAGFDDPRVISRTPRQWKFLWPSVLLSFITDRYPEYLRDRCEDEWLDDHPRLVTSCEVVRGPYRRGYAKPSFSVPDILLERVVVNGFVKFPNGFV